MLKLALAAALAATLLAAASALAATPYYVDSSRPDDSGNGLSWATAKKTIQAAVALAADTDTVWVTNGTYSITTQIGIAAGITLRSMNGYADTIIGRTSGDFSMISLTHADAVLDGFSVTNGYAPASGGGAVYMTAGSVKNCLFDRCSVPAGRKGAAVYMTGGVVLDSVFRNNYRAASASGGIQGSVIHATGGLVERCIIKDNTNNCAWYGGQGAVYGGTFRSCLFFNNSINGSGGASYNSSLQNCTVVENFAYTSGGGTYGGTISNSIVRFNDSSVNYENYSGGTFAYSCSSPPTRRLRQH